MKERFTELIHSLSILDAVDDFGIESCPQDFLQAADHISAIGFLITGYIADILSEARANCSGSGIKHDAHKILLEDFDDLAGLLFHAAEKIQQEREE